MFILLSSLGFAQVQKHHLQVLARKNAAPDTLRTWDVETATGDGTPAGWGITNRNFRVVLAAGDISVSGSKIRVKFTSQSGNVVLVGCGIGEQSSTEDAVSITRITFGSGNTVSGASPQWSDWITFALDETKTYLLTFAMGATSYNAEEWVGAGTESYTDAYGSDESQTADVTGYTGWANIHGLYEMEVVTP